MQRLSTLFVLFALAFVCCGSEKDPLPPQIGGQGGEEESGTIAAIEVGRPLPAWEEGVMDIHFINTTSGECTFVIFPDGTQLIIDAASSCVGTVTNGNKTNSGIRSRWDPFLTATPRGSQIIGNYIRKCMEWTRNQQIDYGVLTHFHNDHFGGYEDSWPKSDNSPTFAKNGFGELFDTFRFGKMMDRGWPDYNYPFDMATLSVNAACCDNYIKAIKWHESHGSFPVEAFKPGSNSQIVLKYQPEKYDVTIQNVASNGEIWTGKGTATTRTFPELKDIYYKNSRDITSEDNCPLENITSCVMKISYGPFDYFAGGDLQYNGRSTFAWKDAELPCAKAVGQVEVMKADHHGVTNTNGAEAMKILNPQAWIVCSWMDFHPRVKVLEIVEPAVPACDIYITNFYQGERPADIDHQLTSELASRVKGYDGHIVVRVYDGGKKYRVITTSDYDGLMTVKRVSSPYTSR